MSETRFVGFLIHPEPTSNLLDAPLRVLFSKTEDAVKAYKEARQKYEEGYFNPNGPEPAR
jgi:hypothetical protein